MQWVKVRLSPAFVSAEVFRIAIKQQWTVKEKKHCRMKNRRSVLTAEYPATQTVYVAG